MNNSETTRHSTLMEFFQDQLQDIYWAEQALVKTLPKLSEAATSDELKKAFDDHLEETRGHVSRLESVFDMLGEPAKSKKCAAMTGIIEEGSELIDETDEGTAQRDVALIFAGQKAEHYEIATYGGLATLAKTMNLDSIAETLVQTLEEEKKADELLTRIAEQHVNYESSVEPGHK